MSIAAERFKFLDKETNIPIQDFIEVNANAVYNIADTLSDTDIALVKEAEKELKKLVEKTIPDNVQELISSGSDALSNSVIQAQEQLQTVLNDAIDTISNLDMPDIVNDMLAELKKLDLDGVKEFFKEALNIGGKFLCDNLNFLKNFSLGFSLNPNILSGLTIGLLLGWLDRFCKSFSAEEQQSLSPKDLIGKMFPFNGVKLTSDNVLTEFSKLYGDYLKMTSPSTVVTPPSEPVFLTSVMAGTFSSELTTLKQAEITDTQKKSYITAIETELPNHTETSIEYNRLLEARGKLMSTKFVSPNRRTTKTRYKNLSTNLGLFAKNIINVDVKVPNYNLSPLESGLYTKLITFKESASNDTILKATDRSSVNAFNTSALLPSLTTEETTYLSTLKETSNSHRTYNLHPTTEEFMV